MQCTDEQIVTFSAFLLRDGALEWWRAVQRRCLEGVSGHSLRKSLQISLFQPVTEMRRLRSSLGWSKGYSP